MNSPAPLIFIIAFFGFLFFAGSENYITKENYTSPEKPFIPTPIRYAVMRGWEKLEPITGLTSFNSATNEFTTTCDNRFGSQIILTEARAEETYSETLCSNILINNKTIPSEGIKIEYRERFKITTTCKDAVLTSWKKRGDQDLEMKISLSYYATIAGKKTEHTETGYIELKH